MDPRLTLSLASIIVGTLFGVGSLYLLLKQKPVVDSAGNVTEVDLPLFGKLKTNYPSLVAFFIGAFLVWFPLYKWPAPPNVARIPVSGKVTVREGSSGEVMVGIVPGNLAPLRDDGSYAIEVLDGEHTYTGVAYFNGDMKDIYLGGVSVENGKGTFNAVLGRRP